MKSNIIVERLNDAAREVARFDDELIDARIAVREATEAFEKLSREREMRITEINILIGQLQDVIKGGSDIGG